MSVLQNTATTAMSETTLADDSVIIGFKRKCMGWILYTLSYIVIIPLYILACIGWFLSGIIYKIPFRRIYYNFLLVGLFKPMVYITDGINYILRGERGKYSYGSMYFQKYKGVYPKMMVEIMTEISMNIETNYENGW